MKLNQISLKNKSEILETLNNYDAKSYDFHFIFCDKVYVEAISETIKTIFKDSILMGCSTAGEIGDKKISEGSFVLTSVKLEKSKVKKCSYTLENVKDSTKAGVSGKRIIS